MRAFLIFPLLCILLSFLLACAPAPKISPEEIEALYRERNLALAYLENDANQQAQEHFRKIMELAPEEALPYANLGMVELKKGNISGAKEWISQAVDRAPDRAEIHKLMGVAASMEGSWEEARVSFERAIAINPHDIISHYQLATYFRFESDHARRHENREKHLRAVLEENPANLKVRVELGEALLEAEDYERARENYSHIVSTIQDIPPEAMQYYEQALGALDAGKTDEALRNFRIVGNFLKTNQWFQFGGNFLRQGRFGEPLRTFSGKIQLQVEAVTDFNGITFVDISDHSGLLEAESDAETTIHDVALADVDGNGYLDLFVGYDGSRPNQLFRNSGTQFQDVSEDSGLAESVDTVRAIFGDYDNDSDPDLFLLATDHNRLYKNRGDGIFDDRSQWANVDAPGAGYSDAVFVDYDHEGDLDLLLIHSQSHVSVEPGVPGSHNILFRNNGNGTFTNATERAGLLDPQTGGVRVLISDFENGNDTDFFIANSAGESPIYSSLRQGRFKIIPSGVTEPAIAADVADYTNDGNMDLAAVVLSAPALKRRAVFFTNEGDGTFTQDQERTRQIDRSTQGFLPSDLALFDYNNDGYQDVLLAGEAEPGAAGGGLRLLKNTGSSFDDLTSEVLEAVGEIPQRLAVGDYDNDGDFDIVLIVHPGRVRILRNMGANENGWMKIDLKPQPNKNTEDGIGTKIEVQAGTFYQKIEVRSPTTLLGLGKRKRIDVVRLTWPNGITQNEIDQPTEELLSIEEKLGLEGSCPFLYSWDGERLAFLTDMLGNSPLGMVIAEDVQQPFDHNEYLSLPSEKISPKAGRYYFRYTEELREATYLDQVELLVVDHPSTFAVVSNEKAAFPPYPPLEIYRVRSLRPPERAVNHKGEDVLGKIGNEDGIYLTNFGSPIYQGQVEPHAVVLDFGDLSAFEHPTLLITGWLYWGNSSVNVATSQNPDFNPIPPLLEVINESGEWETALPFMGFPTGKTKPMAVDLTGLFRSDDRRIRIRTTFQIYWDAILLGDGDPDAEVRVTRIPVEKAILGWHGYSRLYRSVPNGPHLFDASRWENNPWAEGPDGAVIPLDWQIIRGFYTKFGDVTDLLQRPDDQYVIFGSGEGIEIFFDANSVPSLPSGWARDFIFYSNGWVKDMDPNTLAAETVEPLPYQGMPRYPYGEDGRYPEDAAHKAFLEEYNTRWRE